MSEETPKKKRVFDPRKSFATDTKKEAEGVWVELEDEAAVKIRRKSYPEAEKALTKAIRPHKVALDLGKLSKEIADAIITNVLAEHLIVDWKNMFEPVWETPPEYKDNGILKKPGVPKKDADGEVEYREMKFTPGAAKRLLRELPDLRAMLWAYSEQAELFKQEEQEEAAKN